MTERHMGTATPQLQLFTELQITHLIQFIVTQFYTSLVPSAASFYGKRYEDDKTTIKEISVPPLRVPSAGPAADGALRMASQGDRRRDTK